MFALIHDKHKMALYMLASGMLPAVCIIMYERSAVSILSLILPLAQVSALLYLFNPIGLIGLKAKLFYGINGLLSFCLWLLGTLVLRELIL